MKVTINENEGLSDIEQGAWIRNLTTEKGAFNDVSKRGIQQETVMSADQDAYNGYGQYKDADIARALSEIKMK